MKTLLIPILIFTALTSSAQKEKSIIKSEIKEVKVFLSGALVNRSFKSTVDAGTTVLAVESLSPQIDMNSITAQLKGEAMVMSTSFTLDYLKEGRTSPELKRLMDSLEVLTDDLHRQNTAKSVYNEEISMLNANKSIGGSNVGVDAENLRKAMDFYRVRMMELKSKLPELDKRISKLNEKIKRLNEQIAEENGKLNQPYGTILVTVSARQQTTVEIDLSYFAQGASWRPSYDLRAKNVKSPVSLMYKASVRQTTGENWDKVRFTLSTGNPSLGGNKPDLSPWYLRFVVPRPMYKGMAIQESAKDDLNIRGSRDMAVTMGEPEELHEQVVIQENQTMTEFEIKVPYSVTSDGKEVMMDIQSYNLPATYAYYSAPKLDPDAFLMASITGWEKLNLLPGNSNVYLENSYVGQSYINPTVTEDTLKLSFGRDKRINIKRELVKDMNSTKFFGSNVEKEFLYETTVRNTKSEPITITLEDQLPLSTDENIKITSGETSNAKYTAEDGFAVWKLDIGPGESKKVSLGFKVRYPKDKRVAGL